MKAGGASPPDLHQPITMVSEMKKILILITALLLSAAFSPACSSRRNPVSVALPSSFLPLPDTDVKSMFGVDKNININTISDYLYRDDAAYIDVRMFFDPAGFAEIGGEADLTRTIKGFRIVPYPFIATLPELPVSGAYDGPRLFRLTWDETGNITSATPNFIESDMILKDLFPKDKAIFLMCGMGGYSAMMKSLLIFLGWDENYLYNLGGNWGAPGKNMVELLVDHDDAGGNKIIATWRADYAYIDFSRLTRITK